MFLILYLLNFLFPSGAENEVKYSVWRNVIKTHHTYWKIIKR